MPFRGRVGFRKPPAGTLLNHQHPLVPDESWPLTETGVVRDFAKNFRITDLRGGLFVDSPFGLALAHTSTADRSILASVESFVIPTQYFTAMLLYRKTDATLRASGAFGVAAGASSNRCGVSLPFSDGIVYWDFGGTVGGVTRLSVSGLTFGNDVWFFTTGARGMEIWQNGILRAANSANPTRVSSANAYELGTHGSQPSDLAQFGGFHLWRRQLAPADIKHLSTHPWAFFRAPFFDLFYTAQAVPNIGWGRVLSDERNQVVLP
jgi:hypothetical protein